MISMTFEVPVGVLSAAVSVGVAFAAMEAVEVVVWEVSAEVAVESAVVEVTAELPTAAAVCVVEPVTTASLVGTAANVVVEFVVV